ncbi:MAG TPA: hypothetical protein VF107_15215 [Burkholderiaceae bacterium]
MPVLASEAVQRALEQLQGSALSNAVAGDRQHTATLLPLLRPGPHALAAALSAALRQQLRDELARDLGRRHGHAGNWIRSKKGPRCGPFRMVRPAGAQRH